MKRKLVYHALLPLLVTATFASVSGAYAADVVAKIGSSSLGKIVVNGKGMSAYFFDLDKAKSGVSACTGKCSAHWPAILSTTTKVYVSGIKGVIGSIALKSGGRQVTINGRPIYTFALDKAVGQIRGQGAQGLWYVVSPKGGEIKVLKSAAKLAPVATTATPVAKSRY
jgi:predicted lipoprotein with Yx(FWY)xxD motif